MRNNIVTSTARISPTAQFLSHMKDIRVVNFFTSSFFLLSVCLLMISDHANSVGCFCLSSVCSSCRRTISRRGMHRFENISNIEIRLPTTHLDIGNWCSIDALTIKFSDVKFVYQCEFVGNFIRVQSVAKKKNSIFKLGTLLHFSRSISKLRPLFTLRCLDAQPSQYSVRPNASPPPDLISLLKLAEERKSIAFQSFSYERQTWARWIRTLL